MVDLDSVQRTRSGRAVKPAMAWWMNQSLQVDDLTGTFKVEGGTEHASQVLSEITHMNAVCIPFTAQTLALNTEVLVD